PSTPSPDAHCGTRRAAPSSSSPIHKTAESASFLLILIAPSLPVRHRQIATFPLCRPHRVSAFSSPHTQSPVPSEPCSQPLLRSDDEASARPTATTLWDWQHLCPQYPARSHALPQ